MKRLFLLFVIFSGISLHAQQKANAVIKTNGDTVWCDEATIRYNLSNKISKVECKGGSVDEVDGKEVAFVKFSNRTLLFSDTGYDFDEVIIFGKKYYLTMGSTDNGSRYFQILDKDRKFIKRVPRGIDTYDVLEEYFGDCPEFIKAIDKVADETKEKNMNDNIITIAEMYNCK